MVTVDEGMDAARVRGIATTLQAEAERLSDVTTQGRAQIGVLQEAWSGADAGGFTAEWSTAERLAHECSSRLAEYAQELTRQANDQEAASSGDAGPGGAISPGGGRGSAGQGSAGPKTKPDPKRGEETLPYEPIEGPLFTGPDDAPVAPTDVEQGQLGDCWFITSLQSVAATNPEAIRENIHANGDGTYTVTLYEDGEPVEYVVTPEFPAEDGDPQFADNPGQRELWPLLYEKAMAQHMGGSWEDMNQDSAETGIEAITGQDASTEGTGSGFLWLDPPPDTQEIRDIIDDGGQVALSSHDDGGDRSAYQGEDAVVENHLYWVKGVDDEGNLIIVNPWDPTEPAHTMSYDEYRENFSHITTSRP